MVAIGKKPPGKRHEGGELGDEWSEENPQHGDEWLDADPSPYPPVYVAGYLALYGKDGDEELTVSREDVRAALPTPDPLPINVDHRRDCTIGSVLALVDDDQGLFFVGKIDCPRLAEILFGAASDDIFGDVGRSMRKEEKMLYLVANYLPSASLSSRRLAPGERADETYFAHVALCLLGRRVGTVVAYDSTAERAVRPFVRLSRESRSAALRAAADTEDALAGTRWDPDPGVLGRALLGTAVNNMLLKDRWRVVSERRRQAGIEGHKYLQASLKTAFGPTVGVRDRPTVTATPMSHKTRKGEGGEAFAGGEARSLQCHSPPTAACRQEQRSAESAAGAQIQIAERSRSPVIPAAFQIVESVDGERGGKRGDSSGGGPSVPPFGEDRASCEDRSGTRLVSFGMSLPHPPLPPSSASTNATSQQQQQHQTPSCPSSDDFLWVPRSCYNQLVMSQFGGRGSASGNSICGGDPQLNGDHWAPHTQKTSPYQHPNTILPAVPLPMLPCPTQPGIPFLQPSLGYPAHPAVPSHPSMQYPNIIPGGAHTPSIPYGSHAGSGGLEDKISSLIDVLTAERGGGGGFSSSSSMPPQQRHPARFGDVPPRASSPPPRGRKRAYDWGDQRGEGPYYPGEGSGYDPQYPSSSSEWGNGGGYGPRGAKGARYSGGQDAHDQSFGGGANKMQEEALAGLLGAVSSLQREVSMLKTGGGGGMGLGGNNYPGFPLHQQQQQQQLPQQIPVGVFGPSHGPVPHQQQQPQQQFMMNNPPCVPGGGGVPPMQQYPPFYGQGMAGTSGGGLGVGAGGGFPPQFPQQQMGTAPQQIQVHGGGGGVIQQEPEDDQNSTSIPAQTAEPSSDGQGAQDPVGSKTGHAMAPQGAPPRKSYGSKKGGQPCAVGSHDAGGVSGRKTTSGGRAGQASGPDHQGGGATSVQVGGGTTTVDASAVQRIAGGASGRHDPACDVFVEHMMSQR